MKLVSLLEDDTRTKLLHLQQFVIEHYLDGVVETELTMVRQGTHSWAAAIPTLEIMIDLGYWKNVVKVIYSPPLHPASSASASESQRAFYLTLDGFTVMRRSTLECVFAEVEHFPYWFESSLNDNQNWHTSLFDAFIKHHGVKKMPFGFNHPGSDTDKLIHYLLTTKVEVEHTSGRHLPSIDQLDYDELSKTHRPEWKAWNETPRAGYTDAYIIWVKK